MGSNRDEDGRPKLTGQIRSRPMRVAFLVQAGEHAALALDGIFAESYRRWGGRYSLIVPCTEGRIPDAYWPWLTVFDPDVVYSYVVLSGERIIEIHNRLYPSVFDQHELNEDPRLDVIGFRPQYGAPPLSSLSTIFRLARHRRSDLGKAPISIVDSWHTEHSSRFLTDNFGTYRDSFGTSIFPADARIAAELLTIVAPERREDRQFAVPQNLTTIPDELAAFQAIAEGRAISLSLTSLIFAPKLDMRTHRWGHSFNLVVGDSFADRIMFWNGRMLIPDWLDGKPTF